MLANGFTPLHADRCVYVRRKADIIIIIALYVDDLLIASSEMPELLSIKRKLSQQYDMEDMGEATSFSALIINGIVPTVPSASVNRRIR
jgi:hypothetical protein